MKSAKKFKGSKKVNEDKTSWRVINICVQNQEDADIIRESVDVLKKYGYTICKTNDLVLKNEMDEGKFFL